MASIRDEIDEILVDAYGEYEQMAAWDCAFTEAVEVPFQALLLGIPVKVTEFRISDSNLLQCLVVREKRSASVGSQWKILMMSNFPRNSAVFSHCTEPG